MAEWSKAPPSRCGPSRGVSSNLTRSIILASSTCSDAPKEGRSRGSRSRGAAGAACARLAALACAAARCLEHCPHSICALSCYITATQPHCVFLSTAARLPAAAPLPPAAPPPPLLSAAASVAARCRRQSVRAVSRCAYLRSRGSGMLERTMRRSVSSSSAAVMPSAPPAAACGGGHVCSTRGMGVSGGAQQQRGGACS